MPDTNFLVDDRDSRVIAADLLAQELANSQVWASTYAATVLTSMIDVMRTVEGQSREPRPVVQEAFRILTNHVFLDAYIQRASRVVHESDSIRQLREFSSLPVDAFGRVVGTLSSAMLRQRRRVNFSPEQGSLTLAIVLFLSIVAILFSTEIFKGLAYYEASRALDERSEMRAERSAIENAITEAIYGRFGTRMTRDPRTLFNSIETKLNALSSGGSSFAITSVTGGVTSMLPEDVNTQYPDPLTLPLSDLGSTAANVVESPILNRHLTTSSLFGVPGGIGVAQGQLSVQLTRSNGDVAEDRSWNFEAGLVTVPVTNWELIAYGLPASGTIPASAPTGLGAVLSSGFYAGGGRALTASANNPSGDTTVFPSLYEASGVELLPYFYRDSTAMAWDTYEVVNGLDFREPFYDVAGRTHLEDPFGNPTAYFDFGVVDPANPPDAADLPAGMSYDPGLNKLTVDVSAVADPILCIVDQGAVGEVLIAGSPIASSSPFILWIINDNGPLGRTPVTVSGDNFRPFLCYTTSSAITFASGGFWQGGWILGPGTSVVAPSFVTIEGHVSFYSGANPFPGWGLTLAPAESVRRILAPIAPRALIADVVAQN